jgi:hypothetical protein
MFLFRRLLVLALCVVSMAVWAQRPLTTPDFTGFSERDDTGSPSFGMLRLADGGTLLYGRFEVWYDGVRFRDLMRLRPGGEPDTSWRVQSDVAITGVTAISLTPKGFFLSVRTDDARFPGATLLFGPLDASRPLSRVTFSGTNLYSYGVSNYDSTTDSIYVYSGAGLQRISAATGQSVVVWNGPVYSFSESFYGRLLSDSAGGLWSSYSEYSYLLPYYWTNRYLLSDLATAPSAPARAQQKLEGGGDISLVDVAGDYVYLGRQRHRRSDGVLDGNWATPYVPILVTSQYAYFKAYDGLPSGSLTRITRAPTNGISGAEAWVLPLPSGYSFLSPLETRYRSWPALSWPTPGDSGNLAVLMARDPVDNIRSAPVLVVKEDLTDSTDPTVIEYYAPAAKRYFITGRKAEQDALDAMPASFTRTGMRFAAKSSRYRDIPEQPVCRLYAAPDKGGSNSHFYGIGNDCPTLNKLSGLKYEGFDFSVLKPASSGCPSEAPNAVTRLFNNKVATNEGNHRYVVSAATKAKMLGQGWIDEGAVFCSASVTDALN